MRLARQFRPALLALGGATVLSGCATIRSNLYAPDESGVRAPVKLKGMPVTVEVPTHLHVWLEETHYYTEEGDKEKRLVPLDMRPGYELKYKMITTKELYTTDFKRPPSGSVDLKLKMSDEREGEDGKGPRKRYFAQINDNTVDTTITDLAALVQTVINKSSLLSAAKGTGKSDTGVAKPTGSKVRWVTITVAEEVFDLRQPNLEGRIQAFYDEHLNQCAARCGTTGASCPVVPVVVPGP